MITYGFHADHVVFQIILNVLVSYIYSYLLTTVPLSLQPADIDSV